MKNTNSKAVVFKDLFQLVTNLPMLAIWLTKPINLLPFHQLLISLPLVIYKTIGKIDTTVL